MSHLSQTLTYLRARFGRDEEGATMVEYGLLIALIAAVLITILITIGEDLATMFGGVSEDLGGVVN